MAILGDRLGGVLARIFPPNEGRALAEEVRSRIGQATSEDLEGLHEFLKRSGIRDAWNRLLDVERGPFLCALIAPHVTGSVLDLLSGNGMVARAIAHRLGRHVTTVEREGCDGAPGFDEADLDFAAFARSGQPRSFDTVLLCTVLHHERAPMRTLALAARTARKRIVIVENSISDDYPDEYQMLVDLIFNEALNKTLLPCPAKHRHSEAWVAAGARFGSCRRVASVGAAPGVPLLHDIILVEKQG